MKKCIILGQLNAAAYKSIFPLIRDKQLWCGYKRCNDPIYFRVGNSFDVSQVKYEIDKKDNDYFIQIMLCVWFTSIYTYKEPIPLTKEYTPEKYPKYDNFDAIEVSRVTNIPKDYYQPMGVPITFFQRYNPNQFKIIKYIGPALNGKLLYKRYIIQRI